ncbi:MAG: ATP-binding protein [bacterium]|nr:ATP-binding protein [bacterium]
MKAKDVYRLIKQNEGLRIEFKARISSSQRIAKEMVAFANTKGGYILVGVDDNGKIIGIDGIERQKGLLITAAKDYCIPAIYPIVETVNLNGLMVIVVRIEEGQEKPYRLMAGGRGELVYIRAKDKNLMASKEVIKVLRDRGYRRSSKVRLDKNARKLVEYLSTKERITRKGFTKLVNISDRRAGRILVRLVKEGVLKIHTLEKTNFYTL